MVVDHDAIRQNYATFKRHLPRVQAYYAVKANPAPEIVQTLFKAGASFDVASFPEFMLVYELIRRRPAKERQDFVWDKIVYANPVKAKETLEELNKYKPLVTFDNRVEIGKIAEHAPNAGLLVRLRVPNTGSMVELSSKFGCEPGEAVSLMRGGARGRARRRGPELPRRQPVHQLRELRAGAEHVGRGDGGGDVARLRPEGARHRRRLPGPLQPARARRSACWRKKINAEIDRLFPKTMEIIAEPGRFMVATAVTSIATVIGKAVRDGKTCYYIDDSVYHTFSGIIFDHCPYHFKSFRKGDDGGVRGVRPDVRRAGHDLAVGDAAGPAARRPGLLGGHRRLQQRLGDLVQRLPAGEGGARESVELSALRAHGSGRTGAGGKHA